MTQTQNEYEAQVRLLLSCLPALTEQSVFALKGGTAINFFMRNLPRLSVDIDLTYLPISTRDVALANIANELQQLSSRIKSRYPKYNITPIKTREGHTQKLLVRDDFSQIKIEVNLVMRGSLLPPVNLNLQTAVEDRFAFSIPPIPVLQDAELYAGKICAALSRQHPRDFFDVYELLQTQGITPAIRQAFVIYLACAPRPMHELLQPNLIAIDDRYLGEFVNMTLHPVRLEQLLQTRTRLIQIIQQELNENERQFLISLKQGQPNYALMPFNQLAELPALQWKLKNIKKMAPAKHQHMLQKLIKSLSTPT